MASAPFPGYVSDKFTDYFVFTDLEPDDVLALVLFFGHLRKTIGDYKARTLNVVVVSGEGKYAKKDLAAAIFRKTGIARVFANTKIVQGIPSGKDFPAGIFTAWGVDDIKPFGMTAGDVEVHTASIRRKILKAKKPCLLCFQPPRELVNVAAGRYNNATAIFYGSFNFRSLKLDPAKLTAFVNDTFAAVLVYETFLASGAENSVSETKHADFWAAVRGLEGGPNILAHVNAWNKFMLDDCVVSTSNYAAKLASAYTRLGSPAPEDAYAEILQECDNIMRNVKCAGNIAESPVQAVYADIGAAAAAAGMLDAGLFVQGRMAMSGSYTTIDESEPRGNVWFVRGADFGSIVSVMTSALAGSVFLI